MIVSVRPRELAGGAKEQVTRCETYSYNKDLLDDLINEAIEKPCLDLGEVRVRIAIPYANYLEERCKDSVYGKPDIIPLNKYESLDIGPPFCRTYIVEMAKEKAKRKADTNNEEDGSPKKRTRPQPEIGEAEEVKEVQEEQEV
ncbi:hypothetical protein CERZMDRAFT_103018 [Cercospora zeae-maydis SCOH1-5]|uniref:Uncharacterized protein n=1 Tax=Cercospora zeae-maydis SCOH1-5 TaxID=717836 RepID=A0A6A6F0Z3_9PEZI|nr:hypothetical protein CERZMDRAFT_103018 [Cercospora zeae-maydis SCOH1-5]